MYVSEEEMKKEKEKFDKIILNVYTMNLIFLSIVIIITTVIVQISVYYYLSLFN